MAEEISSAVLFDLVELDSQDFPHPWPKHAWEDFFQNNSFYIGTHNQVKLNGFILFMTNVGDSFAHLLKICTKKSDRGNGIGARLLFDAISNLEEMGIKNFYLEVEENNTSAINLYKRHNFKIVHKKKGFYSDGTTALILTRGE